MKAGWEIKKLGEVFSFKNGRAFKKEEWSDKGLPIIRIQNLNNPTAPFNYFEGTPDEDVLIRDGDLLFSWSGTVGSSFGPHLWKRELGVLNQHIFKVQHAACIERKFAFYAFLEITQEIEESVSGAVGLVHITKEKLNNFPIPIPPLSEQAHIVGILDEAFASIATAKANTQKNLENAKAVFESHLNSVFSQRGEGWVEKKLGDVCEKISTGPFGTMLHKSDYVPLGIPLVNPMNIINSKIEPSGRMMVSRATRDRLAGYVLKQGDVVIARRGELGRCAVVTENEDGWLCGTGSFFIRLLPDIDPAFFVAQFSSKKIRQQLEADSVGTTMSSLNHGILESLALIFPSKADQQKMMTQASALWEQIQSLTSLYTQKLTALEDLKKSILHQAFTGNLY